MNFRIVGAILKKDVRSLAPLVALIALLFLADALIVRLDLLPVWSMYRHPGDPGGARRADPVGVPDSTRPRASPTTGCAGQCRSANCSPRSSCSCSRRSIYPARIGTFVADLSLGFSAGGSRSWTRCCCRTS